MERNLNTSLNVKFKHLHPPVDVIIPFHKQYHILSECLRSLISKTLGQIYTITVVDDGSPVSNFIETLEKQKLRDVPIQYLRLPEQEGFGAALKAGFEHTRNPWVCFLHADCVIEQQDWFFHMFNTMQSLKGNGVKLVSAKVDDGGTGAYDQNIIGTLDHVEDKIVEEPLPLICTLVNRQLFDHIGGFIKSYPYGWYEDEELFWRMKIHGYKQAVCGKAFVRHKGGATIKELLKNIKVKKVMESNQETYVKDIQELAKQQKANSN